MGKIGGLYDFECIYESRELVIEVWITFVDKKQTWSYQYINILQVHTMYKYMLE